MSQPSAKYLSHAQQRVLKTLDVLFGHEANGLAPGQIARLVATSASNCTRDLANLRAAGFAEEIVGTGHWRISPLMGQRALVILNAIRQQAIKVEELEHRYTRLPR